MMLYELTDKAEGHYAKYYLKGSNLRDEDLIIGDDLDNYVADVFEGLHGEGLLIAFRDSDVVESIVPDRTYIVMRAIDPPRERVADATFLVAFSLEAASEGWARPREGWQAELISRLVAANLAGRSAMGSYDMSWWVAEDDRLDRSDCDSAIFVPKGSQALYEEHAHDLLDRYLEVEAEG